MAQSRDHNADHEITDINESGLTYYARGRLLTDRFGDTYGWGLDGNLLSAASNSGSESDFTYDALGRRATRKAGGTTTAFVYQGDQVIAEYDNGTLARTYVLGLAIDQPIAMRVGSATYYYARQLNGSIHTVMGNDGSVVEQYQYDAYGFRTILAPDGTTRTASTIGNAYGFTGRYHDDAVGIIDFRARAYSPNLGRFLSRDATYANGLSLYAAYFAPDQSDPSGQLSWGDFNPVNVVKTVGNGLEDAGKAVAGAAGDAANAVGNAVTAATGAASNALGSIATSLGNAVTGLAGAAAGAVNTVVGTAEQAASTLGGAVEQGLSDAAKRTIQAITTAVDEAGALGQVIVNATVDGATWLASQTVSAATTIAGIAEDIGKWTGKIGYDIGKWAGQQAVNVTKGFLTEAWQLATKGFSETWNLVKASGYTARWFLSSPYYIIKDPEAWAKTGLNDAWDLFKASASMALWAGLELAPALTGGQNFLGPVTAVAWSSASRAGSMGAMPRS